MADGATELSFSDRWAKALVRSFVERWPLSKDNPANVFRHWLEPIQREWLNAITWDKLTWFAMEKARQGAGATLLGVEFHGKPPKEGRPDKPDSQTWPAWWQALAVGDTNLFLVRKSDILTTWPMSRPEDFNSRPMLISSCMDGNERIGQGLCTIKGRCMPGDIFLLATDALAQWFLQACRDGGRPWDILTGLNDQEAFADWVGRCRSGGGLRDDDTTLTIIRVGPVLSADIKMSRQRRDRRGKHSGHEIEGTGG